VQAQSGVTIPDLAREMGVSPTYLYKVLPALADEGKIVKDGRGWYPKETAPPSCSHARKDRRFLRQSVKGISAASSDLGSIGGEGALPSLSWAGDDGVGV
jgi:hypothetical protein